MAKFKKGVWHYWGHYTRHISYRTPPVRSIGREWNAQEELDGNYGGVTAIHTPLLFAKVDSNPDYELWRIWYHEDLKEA